MEAGQERDGCAAALPEQRGGGGPGGHPQHTHPQPGPIPAAPGLDRAAPGAQPSPLSGRERSRSGSRSGSRAQPEPPRRCLFIATRRSCVNPGGIWAILFCRLREALRDELIAPRAPGLPPRDKQGQPSLERGVGSGDRGGAGTLQAGCGEPWLAALGAGTPRPAGVSPGSAAIAAAPAPQHGPARC